MRHAECNNLHGICIMPAVSNGAALLLFTTASEARALPNIIAVYEWGDCIDPVTHSLHT